MNESFHLAAMLLNCLKIANIYKKESNSLLFNTSTEKIFLLCMFCYAAPAKNVKYTIIRYPRHPLLPTWGVSPTANKKKRQKSIRGGEKDQMSSTDFELFVLKDCFFSRGQFTDRIHLQLLHVLAALSIDLY
jgi:hypothetical protein